MNQQARVEGEQNRLARVIAVPFHRILDRIDAGLEEGAIEAALPDGTRRLLGGRRDGQLAVVRIVRWRALLRLVTAGSVGWYEAWARGDWTCDELVPLFDLFMRNRVPLGEVARAGGATRLAIRAWHLLRDNTPHRARRNIEAHYDLGNDFYAEWLGPTMTYSSAVFDDQGEPLETAQRRKLDLILARTGAKAGDRVLEIGCGWGSFAAVAAQAGVVLHGITLSAEQKRYVDARALPGVSVALADYRAIEGSYDAVASIEMVEAVGQRYWGAYLDTIARVLRPGGRAALQVITIADDVFDAYASSVDFIQRYVFPGGMLVSESRFRAVAEERGLAWRDPHHFGPDYAETLRRWREQFDAAVRERRLPRRLDARFVRLWRYYLQYCEGGFLGGGITVLQVTLVKSERVAPPSRKA